MKMQVPAYCATVVGAHIDEYRVVVVLAKKVIIIIDISIVVVVFDMLLSIDDMSIAVVGV